MGTGGGKAGGDTARLTGGYNRGAAAFQQGLTLEGAGINTATPSNLEQAYIQGFQAMQQASQPASAGFAFEFPDMSAYQADYAERLAEQQAEAERKAGLSKVSSYYDEKFSAAEQATADVNTQIAEEMAHAKTRGLDYNITPEIKQQRINNAFANYWSESSDQALTDLIGKYGDAGYTWDLPIVRGTATETANKATQEKPAGGAVKAKGPAPKTVEDALGGGTNILG